MYDTFSDELGLLDFERSEHGSGMSQRSQAKRLVAELGRVSRHQGSPMFTVQQMKDIAKVSWLKIKVHINILFLCSYRELAFRFSTSRTLLALSITRTIF